MGKKGKWMSPASLSPICGCSKQKLSKPIMMGGAEEEPEFRRRIVKSASAATAIVTAPSIIFAVTNGSMETIYEVIYLVLFLEVLVLSLFPRTWDKKTYLLLHVSVVMRLSHLGRGSSRLCDIVGLASSSKWANLSRKPIRMTTPDFIQHWQR